jgi:2'-5' RNA ligase
MRLFFAIDVPEDCKSLIMNIIDDLKKTDSDINFTIPDNLHITLKFLGEVHETEIVKIEKKSKEILNELVSFNLVLKGVGSFGNPPKIIWVAIDSGKLEIMNLIHSINNNFDYIRKENRASVPHLTIGRVRRLNDIENLKRKINNVKDVKLCEFNVKDIKLKSSTLTPGGPIYEDEYSFNLMSETNERK